MIITNRSHIKKKNPNTLIYNALGLTLVSPIGFEPMTASLEGRCSIQLSYEPVTLNLSGWQDSNLRPPRPKRGAITGLRYTPNWLSSINLLAPRFLIRFSKSNASDLSATSTVVIKSHGAPLLVDLTRPLLCLSNLFSILLVSPT